MPRKRVASKIRQRNDVLAHPGGWLLFLLGWCANKGHNREPFFSSIEDMRDYYFSNRERVIAEMGGTTDFWAWHRFEEHDIANCEYCQRLHVHDI